MIGLYLLCRIGIANDDFNLTSLMSDCPDNKIIGNLIDFDFEGIAKSKDCILNRRGWERTGTSAFMALELLKYHDCQLRRWYRHDLESSAWCFAYFISTTDLKMWLDGTFMEIFRAKASFRLLSDAYQTHYLWADYKDLIIDWIDKWLDLYALRVTVIRKLEGEEQIAKLAEEDMKLEDKVYIEVAVRDALNLNGSEGLESFEKADTCTRNWIDATRTAF